MKVYSTWGLVKILYDMPAVHGSFHPTLCNLALASLQSYLSQEKTELELTVKLL